MCLPAPPAAGVVWAVYSTYRLLADFKADFKGLPGGGPGMLRGVQGVTMGGPLALRMGVFGPGRIVVTIMNLFKFGQIRVLRQFENLKIGQKSEP